MIKKQQQFIPKGMNQDVAETKVQSDFAHSIKNLRIVTDEDSGTLALVTEKGTSSKSFTNLYKYTEPEGYKLIFDKVYNVSKLSGFSVQNSYYIIPYVVYIDYDVDFNFTPDKFMQILDSHEIEYHYNAKIINKYTPFYFSIMNFDSGLSNIVTSFYFPNTDKYLKIRANNSDFYNIDLSNYESYANITTTNRNSFRISRVIFVLYKVTSGTYYDMSNTLMQKDNTFYKNQYRDNIFLKFDLSDYSGGPSQFYTNNISNLNRKCVIFNNYLKVYTILGSCVLNNTITFFAKCKESLKCQFEKTNGQIEPSFVSFSEIDNDPNIPFNDCIFKIENFNSNNPTYTLLYSGNLNFSIDHPIKTYGSYESENQQRVYWIDGINQPRVINIVNTYENFDDDNDNHFNFCTPVYLNETVNITKKLFGGFFHSGVIQYFMTYVDQNQQESKIFYQSPLYYLTSSDRALSPEETSANSFVINIQNANANDLQRDKLRIYSLHRSSLNATPVAKLVFEIKLEKESSNINVVDTGDVGMNIDPQIILMAGCDYFIPKTMGVKDNSMFFGNIKVENFGSLSKINNLNLNFECDRASDDDLNIATSGSYNIMYISNTYNTHDYPVNKGISLKDFSFGNSVQLNGFKKITAARNYRQNENGSDTDLKTFMYQEEYMLGIQLLHKSGEWSQPIWVGDYIMDKYPKISDLVEVPVYQCLYSSSYVNTLLNNDYIAIRPLVVCNDNSTSRVICQGVINPVLYDKKEGNETGSNYANEYLSSWFFRPKLNVGNHHYFGFGVDDTTYNANWRKQVVFTGSSFSNLGDSNDKREKFIDYGLAYLSVDGDIRNEVQNNDDRLTISTKLVSFNSPEIEFEKTKELPKNIKAERIGMIRLHHLKYDLNVLTSTTSRATDFGFNKRILKNKHLDYNFANGFTYVGGLSWEDKTPADNTTVYSFYVYPWANSQTYTVEKKDSDDILYNAPYKKTISNWRYSQYNEYFDTISSSVLNNAKIVNNNYTSTKNYIYTKDVDKLFIGNYSYWSNTDNATINSKNCFYIEGTKLNAEDCKENSTSNSKNANLENTSVRIQYKSTPHAVLEGANSLLPNSVYYGDGLALVSLINDEYDGNTKTHFKGRYYDSNYNKLKPTKTSLLESVWYIAGDVVKLTKNTKALIKWEKGDTYFQRYNCLKTYSYSNESQNNVVDILSFMIHTRVNLNGCYDDKSRNDILYIDNTNFNKLNDVYNQTDNFFTYHVLDETNLNNKFPNLITWGKQKSFGESIDSWANIHLLNVLDLDGNLGEITALKLWNNKLIAFQNKGISVIKYNENTMLQPVNGAPIELANSGRVSGKEIISNQFGCQNEWSIVNAKSGLYFSDDYNHKIYVLSDGIKCISDSFGFKSYLKNKNYSGVWKPNRNAGTTLRTYYDQQLGDIYFTDGSKCLTYNENINLFTAFYDYVDTTNAKLFDFINVENKNYWILNDFTNSVPLFYRHRDINNLNIFDLNKGYEIEITSNLDPHIDKIFDTVEIRGDSYDISTDPDTLNSGYGSAPPFDKLKVNNEYQDTGEQNLQFLKDKPYSQGSNMKQKFRMWRAAIGRNQKNNQNTRDRIRNYWSRIKLTKSDGISNLRAKIHDIVVDVYE